MTFSELSNTNMPGPPTPISACPLKRLEVRDGSSSRSYNSAPPMSVFTFTLNGERPIDEETGALILVINHGQQLLLSLRLTDALKESPGAKDIINIDKQLLRLSIKVPGKSYTISADFEEIRDFIVAVCLLKKSNFKINELASSTPAKATSILPSVTSLDANFPSSFGPRISSVTSFPHLYPQISSHFSQNETSYTDMLNSPVAATTPTVAPLQPMHSSQPYAPRISSLPLYYDQSFAITNSPAAQFNSYNLYPSRNISQFHKPCVGSLLKHSLGFAETPGNQLNSVVDHISSQGNMYAPADLSPSSQNSQGRTEFSSPFSPPTVPPRMEQSPSFERNNFNRSASDMVYSSVPVLTRRSESQPMKTPGEQSFRDLMPQPRELPFLSSTKKRGQPELTLRKTASLNLASTSNVSLTKPSLTRGSTSSETASTSRVRSSVQASTSAEVSFSITSAAAKTVSTKVSAAKTSRARASASKVPPSRRASKAKASRTKDPKSKDSSPVRIAPTKRTASPRVTPTVKRPSPAKVPSPTRASPRMKRTKPSKASPPPELSPPKNPKTSAVSLKKRLAAEISNQDQAIDEPKPKRSRKNILSPTVDPVVETPKSRIVKLKVPSKPVLSAQAQEDRSAEEARSTQSNSRPQGLPTPDTGPRTRTRTTLIIAEPSILRDLDEITVKLCKQYREDIANGSPEAACEKYYQLQMYEARHDFWFRKLSQGEVMSFEM